MSTRLSLKATGSPTAPTLCSEHMRATFPLSMTNNKSKRKPTPATQASWYESPYYSLVQQKRDPEQAAIFFDMLLQHINLPQGADVLDVACGAGRHAIYLSKLGYRVTGLDRSLDKLQAARSLAQECANDIVAADGSAHFQKVDMRKQAPEQQYDLVLNLFTKLGYFQAFDENKRALKAIRQSLKPQGYLVLDFFNSALTDEKLQRKEEHFIKGIEIEVEQQLDGSKVYKSIRVKDGPRMCFFREEIKLLSLRELEKLFKKSHLEIIKTWGSYDGQPYTPETSERMILLVQPSDV